MSMQRFLNGANASFHTSGFAEVANGHSIGASSPQSFGRRTQIDQGRQAIRRYGDSMIGRGHMREAARVGLQNANLTRLNTANSRQGGMGAGGVTQRPVATPAPRRTFTEPPKRGFTPFS